ncbi:MAG: hypothetical protein WA117_07825 [Verrucomicrobiia bacterium]
MEVILPNRDEWFAENEGFPRPDWRSISDWIDSNIPQSDWFEAWHQASLQWLGRLKGRLKGEYEISESRNFVLLAPENVEQDKKVTAFLESTLRQVLVALADMAADEGYGKHAVLVFGTLDEYYAYIAHFYPDCREINMSSGVFLHDDYMHFVTTVDGQSQLAPVLVHELTHNCLAHLPLPAWLNEGLAMTLENAIAGSARFELDRESVEKHQAFWDEETIQEFWSGQSFHRTDDGSELSYHLSQVLMHRIHFAVSLTSDRFRAFVQHSDYKDAGDAAARQYLNLDLATIVEDFLGPGHWTPRPESWKDTPPSSAEVVKDARKMTQRGVAANLEKAFLVFRT